jgi:hypothetical protein
MANLLTLPTIMEHCWKEKVSLELRSAPGVGKTSSCYQFADYMTSKLGERFGVVVRHALIEDPLEAGGVLHITDNPKNPDEKIAMRTRPSLFPQEWEFPEGIPKYGLIVLDEVGQCDDDQRKVLAKLVDEGRMGNHSLEDFGHWSVVLTSNRTTDKSGVGKPLAFETNRKSIVEVEYSVEAHCQWMVDHGVNHKLTAFARTNPSIVCTPSVPDHDDPFCTPRSFFRSCMILQSFGVVDIENLGESRHISAQLAAEVVCGLIGEGAWTRLYGHLRHLEHMIEMHEILNDPKSARVPDRPDVMWAVVQMMANYAKESGQSGNKDDLMPIFTYLERMPKEFQMTTVRMVAKTNKKLLLDARYSDWVARNRDLIMAAVAADNQSRGLS